MLAQNDDVTPVFTVVRYERNVNENVGCNYVNVLVQRKLEHETLPKNVISTMINDSGLESEIFYDAMNFTTDSAYETNSVLSYSSSDTDTENENYANDVAKDYSAKEKHIEKGKRLKFWKQKHLQEIEILKQKNENILNQKIQIEKVLNESLIENNKVEINLRETTEQWMKTKHVLEDYKSKNIVLQNELSKETKRTLEAQENKHELNMEIHEMNLELQKVKNENREKREYEQSLLEKIKEEKKSLEKDLLEKKNQQQMLDYCLDLANKSNKKLQNSVKQQLKNIDELEKTNEILQEKEESNRNDLCNLVKEKENLKNQIPKIKDLEEKLKKSTENFEMIQDKLFQTQNNEILDNQNNKKKQHMLNSQGQKLGRTLRFIKHFKKEHEQIITTKDCEYFNLENKNRNLQHELISSSNKYNSLKRNIISMEQRLINEVQAKAFLQQKLETAEDDLKSSKNLNNIKEVEYGKLRNENSNLKIKLNVQNQKFENKLKELKDLDKYSADIDKDIFKLFDFMNNFENKTRTNEADLHYFYEYMKYWKTKFQREDHYVPNEISDEENEENEESCENEKLQKEINTLEKCWNNTKFRSPLYQELRVEIEIKKEKLRDPFWQLETEESREKNENILRKRLREEMDLKVPTKTHEILESLV